MKPILMFALVLLASLALIVPENGCTKTGGDPGAIVNPVAGAVVADMVAASLGGGSSTQGATAQMEEAAVFAGGGGFLKASAGADLPTFDTTIVREGSNGSVTYHYEFHYSVALANFGNRLNFNYTMSGTYDAPRISSIDSAISSVVVTNIITADTEYTVNSTYTRKGTQQSKTGDRLILSSMINGTTTDVKISKATHQINSGTALYTVTGRASSGASFSFVAAVTFLGNHQALLTLNGVPYTVDLAAGTASRTGV